MKIIGLLLFNSLLLIVGAMATDDVKHPATSRIRQDSIAVHKSSIDENSHPFANTIRWRIDHMFPMGFESVEEDVTHNGVDAFIFTVQPPSSTDLSSIGNMWEK